MWNKVWVYTCNVDHGAFLIKALQTPYGLECPCGKPMRLEDWSNSIKVYCECGSEKSGSNRHSKWCPKYNAKDE